MVEFPLPSRVIPDMERVANLVKAVLSSIVQDVPSRDQACEACRETKCSAERAATCPYRALGEAQELRRRGLPVVEEPVVSRVVCTKTITADEAKTTLPTGIR